MLLRRQAARVALLDREDRVLLLRASDPWDGAKAPWWELPGGGIEPGEPSAEAAARELFEETGIRAAEIGPCVWTHHVQFTFAGIDFDQHECIHLARGDGGLYRPQALEALEAAAFEGATWWPVASLPELAARGDRIIPPWLPEQLPSVLAAGLPAQPIDLGEQ
ncbi:MAG: NUDIX domain-containing protein [Acidimicrobiaceae bacterium]|nr:NUDIX domain-containing protein [Acidimicrobiaceae bacterium]